MPLDPQVESYLADLAASGAVPVSQLTPTQARDGFAASIAPLFGPVADVALVEDVHTERGVHLRVYRAVDELAPALLYFHGGGWVVGSVDTHDGICRAIAARAGATVVSVDYALAPEHPFPAGLVDAWEATQWVAERAGPLGIRDGKLAVGGDSAGATLAAVVAMRAHASRLALAGQVLAYPVTDHRFDTGSYNEFASGFGLTRDAMEWYWSHYLSGADGRDPEASPLLAGDFGGLPPALVITAGHDPLRDEGRAYAVRLREAGVSVEFEEYEGMIHGFLRMPAVIDRANDALDRIAAWVAAA